MCEEISAASFWLFFTFGQHGGFVSWFGYVRHALCDAFNCAYIFQLDAGAVKSAFRNNPWQQQQQQRQHSESKLPPKMTCAAFAAHALSLSLSTALPLSLSLLTLSPAKMKMKFLCLPPCATTPLGLSNKLAFYGRAWQSVCGVLPGQAGRTATLKHHTPPKNSPTGTPNMQSLLLLFVVVVLLYHVLVKGSIGKHFALLLLLLLLWIVD